MVDVVPFAHQAEEGGFLGTFGPTDMTTPYADRLNLELGKGDWVGVNPTKVKGMLEKFDPNKLLLAFEKFVEYVGKQPGVPRVAEVGRALAESAVRALVELKGVVGGLTEGAMLVFRLLPPPG
jgi:hypothetical protein